MVVACGGVSEPQGRTVGDTSSPASGESPAATVASSARETAATAPAPTESVGVETPSSDAASPSAEGPKTAPVETAAKASGGAEGSAKVEPSGEVSSGGMTAETQTLLAQALDSPGLMWCLTGHIGMGAVIQATDRALTSSENRVVRNCQSDKRKIDFWNTEWPKRIDAAFEPVQCSSPVAPAYPASYYQGPIIDSHLHIPQLPDDTPGAPDDDYEQPKGVDSGLYDNIPKELQPLLGRTININRIACALQSEGSTRAFTFFPTFPEITTSAIEVARRTVDAYPTLFVPFIQASANGSTTLDAKILDVMLDVSPDLFFGFGEVGDSPTESINPLPDSEIYTGDFEVVRDRGMVVWFHPGLGHHENLGRALAQFPEVTFLIHGDSVRPHVNDLMDSYPNVFFTFNDIFDEHIPTFRFGRKADFVSAMRADWDRLLENAVEMYQPMIEAHPDRFMWGTDRGDILWQYDEDIGQLLVEFGRAFIGEFDPEIQDMLGYKNAELLIANNSRS